MDCSIQNYDICLLYGDTWNGLQITITVNGTAKDLTGAEIKSEIKKGSKTGQIKKTLSTADNSITITDAIEGIFKIEPFTVELEPGLYFYDIEITQAGIIKTYLTGKINVNQDVTNGHN